jgi:hypothetical protein
LGFPCKAEAQSDERESCDYKRKASPYGSHTFQCIMAKEILTNLRTTQRVELTVKDRLGSRQQEQQCERADDEKASQRMQPGWQ